MKATHLWPSPAITRDIRNARLSQFTFRPTAPIIVVLTMNLTAPPTTTNPPAARYPQPSKILSASRFCSATAHETPLLTQPTPLPGLNNKPGRKLGPVDDADVDDAAEGPGEVDSSGRHTIIRIGKRDMQELTNSAVEMELGVGGLGGSTGTLAPAAAPPAAIAVAVAVAVIADG